MAPMAVPLAVPRHPRGGDEPLIPDDTTTLRAAPIAASESLPVVLDSFTENNQNHYLIYVGHILNSYVSTLFLVHFDGVTPITV